MNFFQRARYKKMMKHLLHEARHVRNMREDIASAADLADLATSEYALRDAWNRRDVTDWEAAARRMSACMSKIYPTPSFPKIRENVEILAVALAVAMGFRTYFIQPFKIPTGSMQPTLYGITVQPQRDRTTWDRFPLSLVSLALYGERYTEVRATVDGILETQFSQDDEAFTFYIAGVPHRVVRGLDVFVAPGEYVGRGQVIAAGRVKYGDHIFVDKIRYNFSRPKRGDIFVFSTDDIAYPRIRSNSFYIKRLAGLPGEEIGLDPPYLLVDGKRVTEPFAFTRLLNDRDKGYMGYSLPMTQPGMSLFLGNSWERRVLGPGEYLPLGDNTLHSLDGRYFGPVYEKSIVGPAFLVYWPLSPRIGTVH